VGLADRQAIVVGRSLCRASAGGLPEGSTLAQAAPLSRWCRETATACWLFRDATNCLCRPASSRFPPPARRQLRDGRPSVAGLRATATPCLQAKHWSPRPTLRPLQGQVFWRPAPWAGKGHRGQAAATGAPTGRRSRKQRRADRDVSTASEAEPPAAALAGATPAARLKGSRLDRLRQRFWQGPAGNATSGGSGALKPPFPALGPRPSAPRLKGAW